VMSVMSQLPQFSRWAFSLINSSLKYRINK
jgi:hypothetical protein